MARRGGERPATKRDVAEMSEYLGGRIGALKERMDRVEETLEIHSKLLRGISRTVERIEQKLIDRGGTMERVEKLERRVAAIVQRVLK